MNPPLVLAAHGTAAASGRATVESLVTRLRRVRPDLTVRLGYLDVARPRLAEVLRDCRGEVVVVPLLLSTGYHVRHDIPAILAACPQIRPRVAPPLGPDPSLAVALADRLRHAGWRGGPVLLAAAGSRDPATAGHVRTMAALLGERIGTVVTPAYAHAGATGVLDVETAVRRHEPMPTVATYLLAEGYFARRIASAGAPTAAPIGVHPAVVGLVLRRYDEARTAGVASGALPAGAWRPPASRPRDGTPRGVPVATRIVDGCDTECDGGREGSRGSGSPIACASRWRDPCDASCS
jgi:sirohydrochlorin ferrochelatase